MAARAGLVAFVVLQSWVPSGSSARAAEADDDRQTIQLCLEEAAGDDAARTRDGRRACMGRIVDDCLAKDGETTPAMVACFGRELFAWDSVLNAIYPEAMVQAKSVDADAPEGTAPSAAKALVSAQRAWIAFRDADCGWRRASFGGGTLASVGEAQCLRDHTAERTIELMTRTDSTP